MGRTMANLHVPAYNLQVIFSREPLSCTPCRTWYMGCSSIQNLTRLSRGLVLYANKCQLFWFRFGRNFINAVRRRCAI